MSNKTYKDEKGAIYTEDRKILLQIPRGTAEYVVPEGTEEIGEDVGDDELRKLTLPTSLRKIWPRDEKEPNECIPTTGKPYRDLIIQTTATSFTLLARATRTRTL